MSIETEKFIIRNIVRGAPRVSGQMRGRERVFAGRPIASMGITCRACGKEWVSATRGIGAFGMDLGTIVVKCPNCPAEENLPGARLLEPIDDDGQAALAGLRDLRRQLEAGNQLSADTATPFVSPAEKWLFQTKGSSAPIRDQLWPALIDTWTPGTDAISTRAKALSTCDHVIDAMMG